MASGLSTATIKQCGRVADWLASHGSLNRYEADSHLNVTGLAQRIKNLRDEGYSITTDRKPALDLSGREHNGIAHYSYMHTVELKLI